MELEQKQKVLQMGKKCDEKLRELKQALALIFGSVGISKLPKSFREEFSEDRDSLASLDMKFTSPEL